MAAIFSGAGIYAAQNAPSQSYVGKSLYDRQIEFEMKMMTGFVVGMMQAGASVGEYTGAAFDAISRARTEAGRDLCIDDAMARTRNSEDPVVLFRFNTPTYQHLTPKPGKDEDGLSFWTKPDLTQKFSSVPLDVLRAVDAFVVTYDHPGPFGNHYLLTLRDMSRWQEWMDSYDNAAQEPHEFTLLLQSLLFYPFA
ncbi:hypothetical protein [Ligaoa zhengdingensis]|uniref:hypothetical protein n=1 Tax=Ligaoa zhengdingensis TaxID=2763658 RepID=UPI0031CCB0C6